MQAPPTLLKPRINDPSLFTTNPGYSGRIQGQGSTFDGLDLRGKDGLSCRVNVLEKIQT